ncbi:MAG: helix-turn-helix transcriptional regulator [Candidatus Sulfotelmatobacter sp.]
MPVAEHEHFAYHQSVNVELRSDATASGIAAAIGEPARAQMLYCLLDGRARTSTELAAIADITASTASVHLQRLRTLRLVKVFAQGKHRYYSLEGDTVAAALEALSVLAGDSRAGFVPSTPSRLRAARTCYDHIAGTLGVSLHERFRTLGWLSFPSTFHSSFRSTSGSTASNNAYDLTVRGTRALAGLGMDVESTRALRRRFAYPCVDWSERKPHLGGALGAALLKFALEKKWLLQDLDSRVLGVTSLGRREMMARFGLHV